MDGRIDLDRARREAKALLRAARAGQPEALARLRADRTSRLADAQRAVARRLGERSWPALVRRVERGDELLRAAQQGRAEDVYALLEAGAPANARDPRGGGTALHVAARAGWVDVVDVLVGWAPLDLGARDAAGRTAREVAAERSVIAEILASVAGDGPRPLADAGLAEAALAADVALLEHLAGAPGVQTRRVGDGFAVVTGLADNARNGVVASRVPAAEIDATLAWLGAHGVPAQWHVGSESELPDRLIRAGCRPERTAVFMAARLGGWAPAAPAPVEIAPVRDEMALAEALATADRPPQQVTLLASLGLDPDRPLRHWAARRDGATVGFASALTTPVGTLSLLDLHVAAGERRRGTGRALLEHALDAGRRAGCTLAVLAPTPATVPYYAKLGFELGRLPPDRVLYTPVG